MKKPQIIALAAVVLLAAAIVLGVIVNQRAERAQVMPQNASSKVVAAERKTPANAAKTASDEAASQSVSQPPPVKLRYRCRPRPAAPAPDFDASRSSALPSNLRNYRFRAGILVDLTHRRILWESHSTEPVPIASVTKLLTLYTAFEEIEDHPELSLETLVTATTECSQAAPVRIRLVPGHKYSLHELFIFSMLKSANDAAHLIAEYFGYGRSENFIGKMNQKAREIGMTRSNFVNANGLPIYGKNNQPVKMNVATMRDMAKLIERLFDYPMLIRYTSCAKTKTSLGEIANGNHLLNSVDGMDGLKTGYTDAAKNCLAFSCRRNGRHIVGMVVGFEKRKECFSFVSALLDWGFRLQ